MHDSTKRAASRASIFTGCALLLLAPAASANQEDAVPPPPPPVVIPEVPPVEIQRAPDVTPAVTPAAPVQAQAQTDHDAIVGRWGIEARRLGTVQRSLNQDPACTATECPLELNAFSVRRWVSRGYAYSFGLALAAGGGSTRQDGEARTWDTYFGVGPTFGANFLLANFQHLAVSFAPQLDSAFFLPGASAPKTFLVNVRGLFEGELHLGFWGVPQLSVGVASGLEGSVRYVSKGNKPDGVATQWSVSTTGPQSLWGIVTNMFVRFYL